MVKNNKLIQLTVNKSKTKSVNNAKISEEGTLNSSQINDFIKGHKDWSVDQLMGHLGLTNNAVRHRRRALGFKSQSKTYSTKDYPNLEDRIFSFLKTSQKDHTLEELCNHFESTPALVRTAISRLQADKKNIRLAGDGFSVSREVRYEPPTIVVPKKSETIRFGFTADNHLCSNYERLDVLNALYDVYEQEGIKTVYQRKNPCR